MSLMSLISLNSDDAYLAAETPRQSVDRVDQAMAPPLCRPRRDISLSEHINFDL